LLHDCILIIIAVNLYVMYNRILKSLNPDDWNFTLMWSSLAIPFFQPYMTGSNKAGWDHVVDKSSWPTLLLLCISFWALYWVRWKAVMAYGMRLHFYSLISSMIPKNVCILVKWTSMLVMLLRLFYTFINGIL
jgi:hypothetical protein